jgi:hypothetical protein
MPIKLTDAIKQEIVKCLLEDWSEKDICVKFNTSSNSLRKIARENGITKPIQDDKVWKVPKPKIQALKIEKTFTDKYGIILDLEALEYFKEQTKKYFNPVICDVIIAKDKRPYEIQYHITHGFVNVSYIYQDVNEVFKYKFINDFYKNKLTKENLKELIIKKNIFEAIIDKDNNKCIFDLDLFLNDITYKEAVNLSNITKVAPKI